MDLCSNKSFLNFLVFFTCNYLDLANNEKYLQEEELFLNNKDKFDDDYLKKKFKSVVAKIQLLKLGTLKDEDKENFKKSQKKERSVGIITADNLTQFLAHKISVNSVLCRRLRKYKLVDGVHKIEQDHIERNIFAIKPELDGRIVVKGGNKL